MKGHVVREVRNAVLPRHQDRQDHGALDTGRLAPLLELFEVRLVDDQPHAIALCDEVHEVRRTVGTSRDKSAVCQHSHGAVRPGRRAQATCAGGRREIELGSPKCMGWGALDKMGADGGPVCTW